GTRLHTTPGVGPRNRGRCVDSGRALLELLFATGLFVLNRDLALTQLLILLRLLRARPLLLPWSRPRPVVPSKFLLRLEELHERWVVPQRIEREVGVQRVGVRVPLGDRFPQQPHGDVPLAEQRLNARPPHRVPA